MNARMLIVGQGMGGALWIVAAVRGQDKKAEGPSVNVTGCLAQGNEKNEYSIKDTAGKTYGLRAPSEVNLKAHLGHKITITGTPMEEKKAKVKAGQVEESEHPRAINLSIVIPTYPYPPPPDSHS